MEATEVEKIIIKKKNPKFYDKNENSVPLPKVQKCKIDSLKSKVVLKNP